MEDDPTGLIKHRFFGPAIAMARSHPHRDEMRFVHGAVLVKGGSILSIGFNKPKRNGFVDAYAHHKFCNIHAEVSAVLSVRKKTNLKGAKIFVARVNRAGEIAESKPCSSCQNVLKSYGIKRAYYTIENGYKCLNVNSL